MLKAADDYGWGPAQVTLGAFHLMGTAHMGAYRGSTVCDPAGEAWDARTTSSWSTAPCCRRLSG